MTFGEMQKFTQRLIGITGTPELKESRLNNMKNDIEEAYPGLKDRFAAEMHGTVIEEMAV